MDFPHSFKELREIFMRAESPEPSTLEGTYLVDMLTIFPSFKRFSHNKIMYRENSVIRGHNVLFGKKWGHFFIEEDICKGVDQKKTAIINYNKTANTPLIRRIRDEIRCVDRGEYYIGRFNYLFSGKLLFLGYFSLEKIK